MGFHDYCCFIHSEDEQCLELHNECMGKSKYLNHKCDSDEDASCPDGQGYGAEESVLVLFFISNKITDTKIALNLLKEGKFEKAEVKFNTEYSWDGFDFEDEGGPMGYMKTLMSHDNLNLPWKTNNDDDNINDIKRTIPYKKFPWVLCICPTCYKNFLSDDVNPVEICSRYLSKVIGVFNDNRKYYNTKVSKITTNHKKTAYKRLRKEYQWLRRLIRSLKK